MTSRRQRVTSPIRRIPSLTHRISHLDFRPRGVRSPPRGPRDASPNSTLAVAESIFLRRKAAVKSRLGAAPLARCSRRPTRRQALPGYPARRAPANAARPIPSANRHRRPAHTGGERRRRPARGHGCRCCEGRADHDERRMRQAGGKGDGGQVHSTQSVGGNAANAARRRWSGDRASAPSSRHRPRKAASSAPPEGRLSSRAGARKENEETLAFGPSAVVSADAYETPARDEPRASRLRGRDARSARREAGVRLRASGPLARRPFRRVALGLCDAREGASQDVARSMRATVARSVPGRMDRGRVAVEQCEWVFSCALDAPAAQR